MGLAQLARGRFMYNTSRITSWLFKGCFIGIFSLTLLSSKASYSTPIGGGIGGGGGGCTQNQPCTGPDLCKDYYKLCVNGILSLTCTGIPKPIASDNRECTTDSCNSATGDPVYTADSTYCANSAPPCQMGICSLNGPAPSGCGYFNINDGTAYDRDTSYICYGGDRK